MASPFLFNVDLVELDIKFLQAIEKDHLDNILVGLILIFIGITIDRAVEFTYSAKTIQKSHGHLEEAVLQFVETMAQALDARDKHTSGHATASA